MLSEGLNIFRMPVSDELADRTLLESNIRGETGCSVVAVDSGQGLQINPDPAQSLRKGTNLLLVGTSASEKRFMERFLESAR